MTSHRTTAPDRIRKHSRSVLSTLLATPLLALLAGCEASRYPGRTVIHTEPSGASIAIDGKTIGMSPVTHVFRFPSSGKREISASMPGYYESVAVVNRHTDAIEQGLVRIHLAEDESQRRTTSHEAANRFLSIEGDPDRSWDDLWQRLVGAVVGRYSALEMMDKDTGYIRSAPIVHSFVHPTAGVYDLRTRFVGSLVQTDPLVYRFKIESESSTPSGRWTPTDKIFTEDAALLEDLYVRFGGRQ